MIYHNILRIGFELTFGNAKVLKEQFESAEGQMMATDFLQVSVMPSTSTDFWRRTMRINAFRAFQWLANEKSVYDLLIATLSVGPLEKVMWTFLSWQGRGQLVDDDASPIARMASQRSPARQAVHELLTFMLTEGVVADSGGGEQLDLYGLVDSCLASVHWKCSLGVKFTRYFISLLNFIRLMKLKLKRLRQGRIDSWFFEVLCELLTLDSRLWLLTLVS